MTRVAVVSGTRADYGLLRPTIRALLDDPRFELRLLVTAMHLDRDYGLTVGEIEADGVPIASRVPAGVSAAASGAFAINLGRATVAFTEALRELGPELLLVLGDRYEILAAALAATGLAIPIAHLHGGELSEGSLDDATRHCLTKLAHLHFVAARTYGERVCQLGEEPWRVHVVGAAGLESIRELALLDVAQLAASLQLDAIERPLVSLTLHGASLAPERAGQEACAVVEAVDEVLEGRGTIVLTLPNDDPGSRSVREVLLGWSESNPQVHSFPSLGQLRYLSLLRHADLMLGNSSSGVLEAPAFELPTVNVGDRQHGRLLAANVVSVPPEQAAVVAAMRTALEPGFRAGLHGMENPYGDGRVSARILEVIASAPPAARLRRKHFHDLPDERWRERLGLGELA